VILNHDASAYAAVRQGSSTIVIQSVDERLAIPIGTAGSTLAFADGERLLVATGGQVKIGDQAFSGATPVQLDPFVHLAALDMAISLETDPWLGSAASFG